MIIARYLTREILGTVFAVTAVLLLAFLSQQIVRYLNYVAIGKIPTAVLMQMVSFEVPYLLALLLPLTLYLGILLVYGRLYSDHEMSVLQMCGYGNKRILRLTAVIAFFISAIVLYLMLVINPSISAKRQHLLSSGAVTLHLVQTMIPGRFQVSPDGRHVFYVGTLSRDRLRAENVFLAQEKQAPNDTAMNNWTLVLADQGFQSKYDGSRDDFFVVSKGYRYEGVPGQNDYKITQFKTYAVRLPQNETHEPHKVNETLPSLQLWHDYSDPKRAAELQWRFSVAISTFLLAILAVPLSSVRPRQSRYLALLPAILIYIVYINLLFLARHWVEFGAIPVAFGMWWVHAAALLFIAGAMYLSFRQWK